MRNVGIVNGECTSSLPVDLSRDSDKQIY